MFGILDDSHRRHLLLTLLVAAGLAAYLTGWMTSIPVGQGAGFDLALALALIGGFPIYLSALQALARRQISADLAVSLAAAAAIYIGQYAVAAEVIFIMLIGETLEHYAIDRTRAGIAALLALRPQEARVKRRHVHHEASHSHEAPHHGRHHHDHDHDHSHGHGHDHHQHHSHHEHNAAPAADEGHEHELIVAVGDIRMDDIVLVRPGDRIPVDGRVTGGNSTVDQSPITGESVPADKGPGDEVFAGTINVHGALELRVERLGADTTLEQIIHLVEHAEAAKAPAQRLADRYATYFVPIVLVAAAITWFFTRDVTRSVAILVVACPCALVLATPTAIAAAMGSLVRRGVLIKGGHVLEALAKARTVVFDKTGTLTLARLKLAEVYAAAGESEDEVLRLAALVERQSEHPIARVIADAAASRNLGDAPVSGFLTRPGLGAEASADGQLVRVGSLRFIETSGIALSAEVEAALNRLVAGGATVVVVARDHTAVGVIAVHDTIRGEAAETIGTLKALGIERIVMLTGDHAGAAHAVARRLGIADVRSGLLPTDKVDAVRSFQRDGGPVVMVGDGINDAPSLVTADVGVAMADIGSDVTIASAGLILVGDDLRKLGETIALGRSMLRIVWQNILGFALVFNVLAVVAASLGWVSPVVAAVLHQVSSLTVVLNSLRLAIDRRQWQCWRQARVDAIVSHRRSLAATAAAAAALVYLASGLHIVQLGEIGVVQHFGRIVQASEPPGLHYRLPYPFGRHQKVRPSETRRVEVGFRNLPGTFLEPPAYEWNVQHRGGRYIAASEESAVWAGDESLADVAMVVQYSIDDPIKALVNIGPSLADGSSKWDVLVRAMAEAALHAEMSARAVDDALGSRRADLEDAIERRLSDALALNGTGFAVENVCLADVHPPLDVVPAFREVAAALEEKEAAINDAAAYQLETLALSAGQAKSQVTTAEAAGQDRTAKAAGEAARFVAVALAYGASAEVTRLRLYLQAIELALAGKRKVILDEPMAGARRQLLLGPTGTWNLFPPTAGDQPAESASDGAAPADGLAPGY